MAEAPAQSVAGASWFLDETSLIGEVKRARGAMGGGAPPPIPGYDDLVELRRGGQGAVLAGTQRSTKRRVAIKVLLEGALASGPARRRFEREIDLVASLRHPGIVRVYDSGVTPSGWPYFVMEFVEGRPLDEWAADHAGDPRAIVQVMFDVCHAVGYAHQRAVMHRDLKPSNIRVDTQDKAHVLDFGLAKTLGDAADHAAHAGATQVSTTGQFVGSLPWASPEQARGDLERIDTRTDVYALGVILYQLLVGTFPYDLSGGLSSALATIQNAQPAPPRARAKWMDEDLSTIILRALAKEPDRRYQSVSALGDDLKRWLNREPIEARRDSTWYVVRKTVSRHKPAAAAALAGLLMLVGFGVVMAILYARTRAAEASTREASGLFTRVFTSADPGRNGRDVRVADVLDNAVKDLDARPPTDPLVEAPVRQSIGATYVALGQYEAGEASLRRAADLYAQSKGPDSAEALGTRARLVPIMAQRGRSDDALALAEDIDARAARALGAQHAVTMQARAYRGQALLYQGKYDEGARLLQEAMEAQERAAQTDPAVAENLASTMSDLGLAMRLQGKPAPAAEQYERALVQAERAGLKDTTGAIQTRSNLSLALADLGRLDESIAMSRAVLADAERLMDETHPVVITIRSNLATLLIDREELPEAEALLRQALASELKGAKGDSPSALTIKNNLAKTVQDLGRHDEAEALFRETLEARRRVLGEDHPNTLVTASNYGTILSLLKRHEEALAVQRAVLAAQERTMKPGNLSLLITLNNVARTLETLGRHAEAEAYTRRAISEGTQHLPAGHYSVALFKGNLARCLMVQGRDAEAETLLRESIDALTESLGEADSRTQQNLRSLADLLDRLGRSEDAAAARARLRKP